LLVFSEYDRLLGANKSVYVDSIVKDDLFCSELVPFLVQHLKFEIQWKVW